MSVPWCQISLRDFVLALTSTWNTEMSCVFFTALVFIAYIVLLCTSDRVYTVNCCSLSEDTLSKINLHLNDWFHIRLSGPNQRPPLELQLTGQDLSPGWWGHFIHHCSRQQSCWDFFRSTRAETRTCCVIARVVHFSLIFLQDHNPAIVNHT